MYKKNKIYLFILLILALCLMMNLSCNNQKNRGNKDKNLEYIVTPKGNLVIYGVNVNEIIDIKFRDIEKEFGCETKVDSEMAVVFIDKYGDFVQKTKETQTKDHIGLTYGPIEDLTIYDHYKDVTPTTIIISGQLSINEGSAIKESITKELHEILPNNDETIKITKRIREEFISGDLKKGLILTVKFNIPKFPFAEFSVWYHNGEEKKILYQYIFSLRKDPYPY
jgi:hypothetical protein